MTGFPRAATVGVSLLAVATWSSACGGGGTPVDTGSPAARTPPRGDLSVTAWPSGRGRAPVLHLALACPGGTGSVPRPAEACVVLAAHPEALLPPPPDTACTQVYGGPSEALITGSWGGRQVRMHVSRTDGCGIARWDLLQPLLPAPAPAF